MKQLTFQISTTLIVAALVAACAPPSATPLPPQATKPVEPVVVQAATSSAGVVNSATPKATDSTLAPTSPKPAESPVGGTVKLSDGKNFPMLIMPNFSSPEEGGGLRPGAREAHAELGNTGTFNVLDTVIWKKTEDQTKQINQASEQGLRGFLINNNQQSAQLAQAIAAAQAAGAKIVTWDDPYPTTSHEHIIVTPVDFNEVGKVMMEMALRLVGPAGGEFAVISTSPDALNQNTWITSMKDLLKEAKYSKLKLVDVAYGGEKAQQAEPQVNALIAKHPNLSAIIVPVVEGTPPVALAVLRKNLCGKLKVGGLGGDPGAMKVFVGNNCLSNYALWSYKDLGYLTYYVTYLLATGQLKGVEGEKFEAGRLGEFTITKDPARKNGVRVTLGSLKVYTKDNPYK